MSDDAYLQEQNNITSGICHGTTDLVNTFFSICISREHQNHLLFWGKIRVTNWPTFPRLYYIYSQSQYRLQGCWPWHYRKYPNSCYNTAQTSKALNISIEGKLFQLPKLWKVHFVPLLYGGRNGLKNGCSWISGKFLIVLLLIIYVLISFALLDYKSAW